VTSPELIGHRGAPRERTENTLPAFERALALGADGIELDVHLSADGVPVVHHDSTLDRTTNATGPITARTARELSRVDAGYHFEVGDAFPFRGQRIGVPTLREVLERYPDARVIIEMKMDEPQLGETVAAEVRRVAALERVCVAGYGTRSAGAARAGLPGVASSACRAEVQLALYRTWAFWPVRKVLYGGYQIPEVAGRLRVVSPRFVTYAHRAGLKVHVWTVDDEAIARRLFAWGVDGLISNRPDVTVPLRDAMFPLSPH